MQAHFIDSIHQVNAEQWDTLSESDYPFLRHAFFAALEDSGSTTEATGWQPHHLLIRQGDELLGFMPLFLKTHSYGEYVFDWGWADAYHRHGHEYYPKLLNAIPFTPATGERWVIKQDVDQHAIQAFLFDAIQLESERLSLSSQHFLFPNELQANRFEQQGFLKRVGCQYHWFNQNFGNFDDFLATFNSRKRKSVKKERRAVQEQGVELIVKEGAEITEQDWQNFYIFYHLTYFKRSGREGYLKEPFFPLLAKTMSGCIVMVCAQKNNETVAAALYFRDSETLYGRYWGCKEEFDLLHFEACYYQGIEYAITHKLKRFDPGAQGEHKIQRGFHPTQTCSYHYISDSQFRDAIARFLTAETKDMQHYQEAAKTRLPFKQE